MNKRVGSLVGGAVAVCLVAASGTQAQIVYTQVVRSFLPGTVPAGQVGAVDLGIPSQLGSNGTRVIYTRRIEGTGVTASNNVALTMTPSNPSSDFVARTNNAVAGVPNAVLADFDRQVIAAPIVPFLATLSGSGVTPSTNRAMMVVVSQTGFQPTLWFRTNTPIADPISGPVTNYVLTSMDSIAACVGLSGVRGAIRYNDGRIGEAVVASVWSAGGPAEIRTVVATGLAEPLIGADAKYTSFGKLSPNGADYDFMLAARFTGTGLNASNDEAIMTAGVVPTVVFREGTAVPGTGGAVTRDLGDPAGFNDFARPPTSYAFRARLEGGDATPSTESVLLVTEVGSGPRVLLRAGVANSSLPSGVTVSSITDPTGSITAGSGMGMVVKTGLSDGRSAFWGGDSTGLVPRVLTGQTLAGEASVSIASLGEFAFDSSRIIIFRALLEGSVTGGVDDQALLASLPNGELRTLLRTGQTLPLLVANVPTISPVVTGFDFTPGNNFGAVTPRVNMYVRVDFADGTQAIVSFAVPGPGAASVLALAGLVGARRRRCGGAS